MAAKALHIILVITVFFSTTGFTLRKHYCKAEIEHKTCAGERGTCCASTKDMPANDEQGCSMSHHCDKDCCQNIAKYYQLDEDKQVQNVTAGLLKKPALIATLFVVFNYTFPTNEVRILQFNSYKPPIVQEDILVLLQTFLL